MKKLVLLLLIFITGFSLFPNTGSEKISLDMSLKEISVNGNIPFTKLTDFLENGKELTPDQSLRQAGVSVAKIKSIVAEFREEETSYLLGVSGIGMLIVFSSLILISIIISLMKLLNTEKTQKVLSEDKSVTNRTKIRSKGQRDLNPKILASISTTIYLHELEIDEENKLLVTLNRTSGTKMWKLTNTMPNTAFYTTRRNK